MLNIKDKYLFIIILILLVIGIIYLNNIDRSGDLGSSDSTLIDDGILIPEDDIQNPEGENAPNPDTIVNPPKENTPTPTKNNKITLVPDNKKGSCESQNGTWYEESKVCEINSFSENQCIDKGGEWNGCASACRHDKDAEVCTLQCVLTCSFR